MHHDIRIEIDRSKCVGSSTCIYTASGIFELDSEGKAIIINNAVNAPETIIEAAESCPVHAITVIDTRTGQSLV